MRCAGGGVESEWNCSEASGGFGSRGNVQKVEASGRGVRRLVRRHWSRGRCGRRRRRLLVLLASVLHCRRRLFGWMVVAERCDCSGRCGRRLERRWSAIDGGSSDGGRIVTVDQVLVEQIGRTRPEVLQRDRER